jgi:hypothetical protein
MSDSPAIVLYDEVTEQPVGIVYDGTVYRLQVEAKLGEGGAKQKVYLIDGVNEIELAIEDGELVPTDTRSLLISGADQLGYGHRLVTDGEGVLKVSAQPPLPPPGTNPYQVYVPDADLSISAPPSYHDTEGAIVGDGDHVKLQVFTAGAAGDPNERGSRIDVLWREGAGPTDHIIERMYVGGQTVTVVLPDVHDSRDGTDMIGDGSTTKIVIRRWRLSNAASEVDAIVRGYLS